MLVLTRREDESLAIGPDIVVTVLSIKGGQVRLGVDAPPDVRIFREELLEEFEESEGETRAVLADDR